MAHPTDRDPDMRAAEYVLGTLPAEEAAEVARELTHDQDLQTEVAFWEEQLGQLGLSLAPVDPPPEVWAEIRARLDARSGSHRDTDAAPTAPPRRKLALWQGLAAAASVAALVLAGLLYTNLTRPLRPEQPTYASMFYDEQTSTGWLVSVHRDTGKMSVAAVGDYPLPEGKELRLWVIPEGGKPIASGIVPPGGRNAWSMSSRVAQLMSKPATVLAVSLEAAGQPVSDGPQGPILWQAQVNPTAG